MNEVSKNDVRWWGQGEGARERNTFDEGFNGGRTL